MAFLIGIGGLGGSGKTTLARKLQQALPRSIHLEADCFSYPPSGKPGEWWGPAIKDYGMDWQRLRDDMILPFMQGQKEINYTKLNWATFGQDKAVLKHDADILIVDHITSLRSELRPLLHAKIWVEAEDEGRIERICKRDGDSLKEVWQSEIIPLHKGFIQEHRPIENADIVYKALEATEDDFASLVEQIQQALAQPALKRSVG